MSVLIPSRSFFCMRHGVTDWNRQGLFQGRTDNALNDDGIAQAHSAAERLQSVPLGHVVSSPLLRARGPPKSLPQRHHEASPSSTA